MIDLPEAYKPYRLFCIAEAIRAETHNTIKSIYVIGTNLKEAQVILKEKGEWVKWLKDEFEMSHQTAYNLMNASDFLDRRPELRDPESPVSCTTSALYLLASSTEEEVDEVLDEIEGRITRIGVLRLRAAKWTEAVEKMMEQDEGAAYHAIEQAMHDQGLRLAALDLFTKHEDRFSELAGEDVPTMQRDVGMTFEERNPPPNGALPPRCQFIEDNRGVNIMVWIDHEDGTTVTHCIAHFPRQLPPVALSYRNAALYGTVKELKVRPWDVESAEVL